MELVENFYLIILLTSELYWYVTFKVIVGLNFFSEYNSESH